jgi:hypothetical protein
MMIAVKMSTLMRTELDGVSEPLAKHFCKFAEAKIKLGEKAARYNIKRVQDAADFCCDNPKALFLYQTISEAKHAISKEKQEK